MEFFGFFLKMVVAVVVGVAVMFIGRHLGALTVVSANVLDGLSITAALVVYFMLRPISSLFEFLQDPIGEDGVDVTHCPGLLDRFD